MDVKETLLERPPGSAYPILSQVGLVAACTLACSLAFLLVPASDQAARKLADQGNKAAAELDKRVKSLEDDTPASRAEIQQLRSVIAGHSQELTLLTELSKRPEDAKPAPLPDIQPVIQPLQERIKSLEDYANNASATTTGLRSVLDNHTGQLAAISKKLDDLPPLKEWTPPVPDAKPPPAPVPDVPPAEVPPPAPPVPPTPPPATKTIPDWVKAGTWDTSYESLGAGIIFSRVEFSGDHGTYTIGVSKGTWTDLNYVENYVHPVGPPSPALVGKWSFGIQNGYFVFRAPNANGLLDGYWGFFEAGKPGPIVGSWDALIKSKGASNGPP